MGFLQNIRFTISFEVQGHDIESRFDIFGKISVLKAKAKSTFSQGTSLAYYPEQQFCQNIFLGYVSSVMEYSYGTIWCERVLTTSLLGAAITAPDEKV